MKFENDFEQKFARMDFDFQMLKMKAAKSGFFDCELQIWELRIEELYI